MTDSGRARNGEADWRSDRAVDQARAVHEVRFSRLSLGDGAEGIAAALRPLSQCRYRRYDIVSVAANICGMLLPKTPALTTDCAIFDGNDRVLLIRRGNPPFEGAYALPGGFVEIGETVDEACRREVLEEVGIEVGELRLVGVY